jgi:hypothetical protein
MSGITISTTSDISKGNLYIIRKRLNNRWMLLALFVGIVMFFGYLLYINLLSIRQSYKVYKENAHRKDKAIGSNSRIAIHTEDDDEEYNDEDDRPELAIHKKKLAIDNTTIKSNIEDIKSDYKSFNQSLKQHDPQSQDIIDEKIVSHKYDNYKEREHDKKEKD